MLQTAVPHTTPGATTGQSTTPNNCRNGWVSFQGSCYLFGDVASRSFTAAKICSSGYISELLPAA
ncbi:hypothetical protein MAR_028320 [Mya arenaria]|uniref:Uncharacterized protein n=1 Tax=Mya arenaria TaxID=6604 RepID=A0ABY7DKX3_MYAAR|nr:hypothetical protein MAR_028320 [Mya arenaria]